MVNFLWENLFRPEGKTKDILHALSENYLFENLSKKELRFVKEMVHLRTYRPGEPVFRQGEIGVGMYIIVKGSVDVFVEDTTTETDERRMSFVTKLTQDDFLGELSLVEEGGRRTATAIASVETVLIGFFKPDLMEILERQPATGVKIVLKLAEVLGRRLKETTIKVSELKREVRRFSEEG